MADVKEAIDFVLKLEDATLSGVVTVASDGKRTRYGIDEHYHPELTNCLFYTSMGSVAALKVAESVYANSYANPLCIAEIENQDVANHLLSLGVNCGVSTAARMLQRVLGIAGDGRIGPITLDAIDRAVPATLLADLREAAIAHYTALVEQNPALDKYLAGWINRAEA